MERRHPLLVRRGGDDDDGAVAPEPTLLLLEEMREREFALRLRQGQRLQDARVLLGTAGRVQERRLGPEGQQAQHAVGLKEVIGEGGGDPHPVLLAAAVAQADLDGGVEVQEQPNLASGVRLERLHDQPIEAGGGAPVDAVVAVAGLVVADAGGIRGNVVRPPPHRPLARELRGRRPEVGELFRLGEDEEGVMGAVAAAEAEEPEGVARGDPDRPHGESAAAGAGHAHLPVAVAVGRQGDDGTGGLAGHVLRVLHLQPELCVEGAAGETYAGLGALAHLEAVGGALYSDVQPAQVRPGPDEGDRHQPADNVGGAVEQPVAADQSQPQHRAEDGENEQQILVAMNQAAEAE